MALPTCLPTNGALGFPFLHILPAFVICVLFDDSHSHWCEVYLIVVSICITLMISEFSHLFM